MSNFLKALMLVVMVFIAISCRDQSPSGSSASVVYHTSGCIRSSLEKVIFESSADSIFNYSFDSNGLDLEFSIIASCGRSENAFIVGYMMHGDTLDINVVDTCKLIARCNCMYMVSVSDIPVLQDRFMVRCMYNRIIDSVSYKCHVVEVSRPCGDDPIQPGQMTYNQIVFDREGGGNLIFTITPTPSIDTLLFEVKRKAFRDTSILGVLWNDRITKGIFDTLSGALNGTYTIAGNYSPDTVLPIGTWTFLYMVDGKGKTEVTNRTLRNTLLKFESLVLSKL
jgi:hypothetical protein